MQNAKDTFFITLQSRLAALNPARTIVVRGVTRPGVLVDENELVTATKPPDVFRLLWTGTIVDTKAGLPLVAMQCEIRYTTDGNAGNGGMDRGRLLARMDAELATAVGAAPQNAAKMSYAATTQGGAATAMATNIFWGDAVFGKVVVEGERLERTATVEVFSYQEAGEL
ncbi:hypothetical protein [Edaphobacter bradus]|uniref:hypothetical protein n=1 Tax=Edaphobacter bradus TaxID=2259016 RepID=UPI0021E03433|nr:hypothetical protein [Edaphobacter bradus]